MKEDVKTAINLLIPIAVATIVFRAVYPKALEGANTAAEACISKYGVGVEVINVNSFAHGGVHCVLNNGTMVHPPGYTTIGQPMPFFNVVILVVVAVLFITAIRIFNRVRT